jgi:hypothetical protein
MSNKNWIHYEDENFKVLLEDREGYLFLHVYVFNYNRMIKKQMAEMFEEIKEWADEECYDGIFAYTPNPKFCRVFGKYNHLRTINLGEEKYEVLQWELK